jgi:hypothetical protein
MKKLFKKKLWRLPIALLIVIAMLAIGSGAVLASGFTLNKDIPATVTVEFPAEPATLYSDLQCTTPIDWDSENPLDFGTLTYVGETQTATAYFKSTVGPMGQDYSDTGEIDPSTIVITDTINEDVATFMGIVGTPFSAPNPDGSHSCVIAFSVTAVGEGTTDFTITVTGNS